MRYRLIPQILLVVAAGLFIFTAGTASAKEINFDKLRNESVKIKTLRADFTQKKFMKILSRPLVSEGRFYFASPDSFRWEYLKPLRSIVVSHNGAAKRYIYSEGRMIEDKSGGVQAMKIVLNEITGWMNGRFDQNPSFKAIISEGANIKITLTPTQSNTAAMIEKIEITLVPKTTVVRSVKIFEGADTYTLIDFKNVQVNQDIDPLIFQDIK